MNYLSNPDETYRD